MPRETLRKTASSPAETFLKALSMPDDEEAGHEAFSDALDASLSGHEHKETDSPRTRDGSSGPRNQRSNSSFISRNERAGDHQKTVNASGRNASPGALEDRLALEDDGGSGQARAGDRKAQPPNKWKPPISEEEKVKYASPAYQNGGENRGEKGTTDQPSTSVEESSVLNRETTYTLRKRTPSKTTTKKYGAAVPRLSGIKEDDEAGESAGDFLDRKHHRPPSTEAAARADTFTFPPSTPPKTFSRNFGGDASGLLVNGVGSSSKYVRGDEGIHEKSGSRLGLKPAEKSTERPFSEIMDGPLGRKRVGESFIPGPTSPVLATGGGAEARNRWRRATKAIVFSNHFIQSIQASSSDLLEHVVEESGDDDASNAGAAAFEGAKVKGRFRSKGRKGMEGMIVRQDNSVMSVIQDFYVACLKMPISHFLLGVFLAPIALGLIFTPLYLLDRGGLTFDGKTLADAALIVGRVAKAKRRVSALANVFLYALSLSTTFGGSPVAALSAYCLCVANVNTLMGQFLFVFLSGAVFARMSQPSEPIRCASKAIIRRDDYTATTPNPESSEKYKVFAIRLVLTGPPPCELVDAKICVTFRIFVKLPSGSMFCSTQDLDLVRPEVSYLRYGIMVRHVMDKKSPMYGHTMESLLDGDASFSLTVMGLERASMQPIFHLEDYFVCDGDVAWDADYVDFIHINEDGQRVLDHAKIDLIQENKDTKIAKATPPAAAKEAFKDKKQGGLTGWKPKNQDKTKALHSKSTSFTRAF